MNVLLLSVLFAVCEGQSTTKHKNMPAGSSYYTDQVVHEEVKALREQLLKTNAKLQAMEKTQQSQHDNINNKLDKQFTTYDGKMEVMENNFTALDSKLEGVDENLSTVNSKLEDVEEKLTTVDSNFDDIDTDLIEVKKQLGQVTEEKEARTTSAFFARGVKSCYGNGSYGAGDRLVYLNTRLNPGGHYNNVSGEYRCAKTGVYYFTYSTYGYQIEDGYKNNKATANLMKDGQVQGTVYVSNDNTEGIYITLSQSAVLQCNAGERVWVESRNYNNHIRGYSERNVFAGVLLSMN